MIEFHCKPKRKIPTPEHYHMLLLVGYLLKKFTFEELNEKVRLLHEKGFFPNYFNLPSDIEGNDLISKKLGADFRLLNDLFDSIDGFYKINKKGIEEARKIKETWKELSRLEEILIE